MTQKPDDDLGAPIDALAELRAPASVTFVQKLRERIDRRVFAASLIDMTWGGVGLALAQFMDLIFGLFGPNRTDRGGSPPWNKKD